MKLPHSWSKPVLLIASFVYLAPVLAADSPKPPESLASLLDQIDSLESEGRYQEVLELAREARTRAASEEGTDAVSFLTALEALGRAELQTNAFEAAERSFRQASDLRETRLTGLLDDAFRTDDVAWLSRDLEFLAVAVLRLGRVDEAIALLWRTVDLLEGRFGGAYPELEFATLSVFKMLVIAAERPDVAGAVEARMRSAYDRMRASLIQGNDSGEASLTLPTFDELMGGPPSSTMEFGRDAFDEAGSAELAKLSDLMIAFMHEAEGRLEEAEAILKPQLESEPPVIDRTAKGYLLGQLAGLVLRRGRPEEARDLYRESLRQLEAELGNDHIQVSYVLDGLGLAFRSLGQLTEAEGAFRRSADIRRLQLGEEHAFTAHALGRLAIIGAALQRPAAVQEPLVHEALGIYAAAFRFAPERVAGKRIVELDSWLESIVRQAAVLEPLGERLNRLMPQSSTADSLKRAEELASNLAPFQAFGRHTEVEERLRQAIAIRHRVGVLDDPALAMTLTELALSYLHRGRGKAALESIREASGIQRRRLVRLGYRRDEEIWRQQTEARQTFLAHHRAIISELSLEKAPEKRADLLAEAFEVAQLALSNRSAISVARMSARNPQDLQLAELVRQHQDLISSRDRADLQLAKLFTSGASEDRAARDLLRQQIEGFDLKLGGLAAAIGKSYPDYAELAFPQPLKIDEVRRWLRPGEAILVFVGERDTSYMVPDKATYVWWIDGAEIRVHRSRLAGAELSQKVQSLRRGLDPLSGRGGSIEVAGDPGFDFETANHLYREFLSPFTGALSRTSHLFVVMDGPLESLPLGVLLEKDLDEDQDYRQAAWLARRLATSVLPGVSSLALLRSRTPKLDRQSAFLGFANPLFTGPSGSIEGIETIEAVRTRGELATVEDLRRLAQLPESESELKRVAARLGMARTEIYAQERATETQVRSMDLEAFSVIAFATHGLTAGVFPGISEPALVLTPPEVGSPMDDGLLTASEIAGLRLRADWVILSACNTAAGDGSPGAEGLSGLAKAFFYAGARNLLVSHWSVLSDAALELDTGMVRHLQLDPQIGRSEALRRAMTDQIKQGTVRQAHPRFWAPFVLVGDGG